MSNNQLQSKLPHIGTSIFTEMSGLAIKTGAINLSQGFPEFSAPNYLKEMTNRAINADQNQYSPSSGQAELLTEITKLIKSRYDFSLDADKHVTVTSGATEALFVAIQAIVNPNDEVIIFDPAYDSYEPAVNLAGGKTIHIPLTSPEYKINWQQVKDKINANTKAIITNTPHNPTGSLLDQSDLEMLESIVVDNQLYLISDEVYEFITFDGERHESVLRYPKLFERSFIISSFGKTFHCTGWKMGYCAAPEVLTQEFRKIHQYVTFCSPTPFQHGIAKMLKEGEQHISELSNFYQQKRDLLAHALRDSRFKVLPAKGTYFLLLDYSEISELGDRDFCNWLTEEVGVATIPLSPFYKINPNSKVIRLCFAKNENTLLEAARKLSLL